MLLLLLIRLVLLLLGLFLVCHLIILFDRQYSAFAGERTFSRGEPFGFDPSPGRTWQVSVTLRWGP